MKTKREEREVRGRRKKKKEEEEEEGRRGRRRRKRKKKEKEKERRRAPTCTLQMCTHLSKEPEAMYLPSGEKATLYTGSRCLSGRKRWNNEKNDDNIITLKIIIFIIFVFVYNIISSSITRITILIT